MLSLAWRRLFIIFVLQLIRWATPTYFTQMTIELNNEKKFYLKITVSHRNLFENCKNIVDNGPCVITHRTDIEYNARSHLIARIVIMSQIMRLLASRGTIFYRNNYSYNFSAFQRFIYKALSLFLDHFNKIKITVIHKYLSTYMYSLNI